jgi:sugar transferase (PEP-CTERM system associated)
MLLHLPKRQFTLLGGDIILIIVSLYLAPVIRFGIILNPAYVFESSDALTVFIYLLIFYIFDFYNLEELRSSRYIIRFILAATIASILISSIYYIFHVRSGSQILFISSIFICFFLLGWRYALDGLFEYSEKPGRLLILGAGQTGGSFYEMLKRNRDYEIVGFLDDDEKKWGMTLGDSSVIGGTGILTTMVKELNIDKVIIAIRGAIQPEVYKRLVEAKFNGVGVYGMPTFYERVAGKIPVLHTNDMWLVYYDIYGVETNLYNVKIKKIIDKTFALIGLILALPLMCIVALAVKIDSKGPVFYRQRRVGFNDALFDLIKFRSMKVDAERDNPPRTGEKDSRITHVGRIIRLFRFDEIPQLWNVLKGDMSFIGPRALMTEEVNAFTSRIPYFNLRHSIRPGITGWAQINYPHGATEEDALEKLQYDLFYIKNLSPLLDLHIFLRTIYIVLSGKGAR